MPDKESVNNRTPKKAGRPKGSLNKKTEHFYNISEKNNFDVAQHLMWWATGNYKKLGVPEFTRKLGMGGQIVDEPTISPELRYQACKDFASFMYPKLKAVEHTIEKDAKASFSFSYNTKPMNQDEKG